MDVATFVQNVKDRCSAKGIGVTAACQDSGAGKSFISDINRGIVPRVERLEKLATYLGCTVSDLLGEKKEPTTVSDDGPSASELIFRALPPAKQEEALRYMRFLAEQEDK